MQIPPEERAASTQRIQDKYEAQRAADDAQIDSLMKRCAELRARLPAPDKIQEQLHPGYKGDELPYVAVNYAFLQQFTDQGFVPSPGKGLVLWYRDTPFKNIQIAAVPSQYSPRRDNPALLGTIKDLERVPYVAVLLPVEQDWPTLKGDGKTFQAGFFTAGSSWWIGRRRSRWGRRSSRRAARQKSPACNLALVRK